VVQSQSLQGQGESEPLIGGSTVTSIDSERISIVPKGNSPSRGIHLLKPQPKQSDISEADAEKEFTPGLKHLPLKIPLIEPDAPGITHSATPLNLEIDPIDYLKQCREEHASPPNAVFYGHLARGLTRAGTLGQESDEFLKHIEAKVKILKLI
jgi:hypothetical protein